MAADDNALRIYVARHRRASNRNWHARLMAAGREARIAAGILSQPLPRAISQRARRKEREAAGGAGWTESEWTELLARYGNRCLNCGSGERLVPDHVVPLIRGGAHSIANIQPLCSRCNLRKGVQVIDYRPLHA